MWSDSLLCTRLPSLHTALTSLHEEIKINLLMKAVWKALNENPRGGVFLWIGKTKRRKENSALRRLECKAPLFCRSENIISVAVQTGLHLPIQPRLTLNLWSYSLHLQSTGNIDTKLTVTTYAMLGTKTKQAFMSARQTLYRLNGSLALFL